MSNIEKITDFPRPKVVKEQHRRQKVTLEFDPKTRRWKYRVDVRKPVDHVVLGKGYASLGIARRYAREAINLLLDGER